MQVEMVDDNDNDKDNEFIVPPKRNKIRHPNKNNQQTTINPDLSELFVGEEGNADTETAAKANINTIERQRCKNIKS